MPAPTSEFDKRRRRGRALGAAVSVALHAVILFGLLWPWPQAPVAQEPPAMTISLYQGPPKEAKPAPPAPAARQQKKPPPRPKTARPPKVPTDVEPVPEGEAKATDTGSELSESQIAGAAMAGSGGGGGGGGSCDMAARVQSALRRDPIVRTAVAATAGKATLVWNGDWVRSNREDGKGLAAVREAIMWEVAFAPPACRAQSMRGLVMFSLNGDAGPARVAVGSPYWRWSDLLRPSRPVTD